MHACEMTLAYLRGGLSTCSAVWVEFEYFSRKFIKHLMQLVQLIPSLSNSVYACATLFLRSASFALVCDFEFGVKMSISRVSLSIFSDLTCYIATTFAKLQESLPVGYISFFFQLLDTCVLHWEYCSVLALCQDFY